MPEVSVYPLRPELMESTFTLYRATKDPLYVEIGRELMCDLQATAATCGYATLHNVVTKEQEDRMESFFLSETLKYLYLLFDANNILHTKAWNHIFTTQGHIIPVSSIYRDSSPLSMDAKGTNSKINQTLHKIPKCVTGLTPGANALKPGEVQALIKQVKLQFP